MPISDLFSKSEKRAKGDVPDVWIYDALPEAFRVQVVHIWQEAFGSVEHEGYGVTCPVQSAFRLIRQILCKEYGMFRLDGERQDAFSEVANFFLQCREIPRCLDVIQLTFSFVDTEIRERRYQYHNSEVEADAAIEELNARFREHGIGHSYHEHRIIRVDSQFIHSEAVKPALFVLSEKSFRGANEEFLKAHGLYRNGDFKGAIAECLKAFESTLKTICERRRWPYKQTDTAKVLLDVCFANNLLPDYLQSEFSAVRGVLEAGVPTIRNRTSGHGQGVTSVSLPQHLASYALHLTASSILFLVECDKTLK